MDLVGATRILALELNARAAQAARKAYNLWRHVVAHIFVKLGDCPKYVCLIWRCLKSTVVSLDL